MNTSVLSPPQARAREVEFVPDAFVVHLEEPSLGVRIHRELRRAVFLERWNEYFSRWSA